MLAREGADGDLLLLPSSSMSVPVFSRRAAAALFLQRQHLDRPRGRRLTAASLSRFAEDTGGIQLDSINVVERAHYLTLWSRFGAYDRAVLDRLVYRRRLLFEYWAHVACLVPTSHFSAWRRAMLDYRHRHKGWGAFLAEHPRMLDEVEAAIRESGPLGNQHFRESKPKGASGWWSWKPATHALDHLFMSGRTTVHSRVHFQKRFDLLERVLPQAVEALPLESAAFRRWHIERSLHAMGAATETDLRLYLTFPRLASGERSAVLRQMIRNGEVAEIEIEGRRGRWYALTRDLESLSAAGRRRVASRGATLLSPFDSFLWHRDRVVRLFGFDYRIEVYVPAPQRTFGYYSLPLLVDGHLVGKVDTKMHRATRRLELRHVFFEPWLARGEAAPGATRGEITRERAIAGLAEAARSLAEFTGADDVEVKRVTPGSLRGGVVQALQKHTKERHEGRKG